MRAMFCDSDYPCREHREDGIFVLEAPAALSPPVLERLAQRERLAGVNAVTRVSGPSSVAIVGASRRPEAVGSRVLANLLAGGYRGELHVVSRHGGMLQGCRSVTPPGSRRLGAGAQADSRRSSRPAGRPGSASSAPASPG